MPFGLPSRLYRICTSIPRVRLAFGANARLDTPFIILLREHIINGQVIPLCSIYIRKRCGRTILAAIARLVCGGLEAHADLSRRHLKGVFAAAEVGQGNRLAVCVRDSQRTFSGSSQRYGVACSRLGLIRLDGIRQCGRDHDVVSGRTTAPPPPPPPPPPVEVFLYQPMANGDRLLTWNVMPSVLPWSASAFPAADRLTVHICREYMHNRSYSCCPACSVPPACCNGTLNVHAALQKSDGLVTVTQFVPFL